MQNFTKYNTIFFDLDGTLSDSALGIIRCLQYSLEKFNIVDTEGDKLRHYIGPSLTETYTKIYGMSDEEAVQATEFYRERFEREGIKENVMFEGVDHLLAGLKAQKKTMVLATAKPTEHAKKILEYYQIDHYFTVIAGSNLDGTREHKGEVIEFALSQLENRDVKNIIMVGDRQHDILGAKENDLAVIGVGYGYGTLEELTEAKPDKIVTSVEELSKLLLGK
ncbi:MAG: 5-nucleotidase [Massilibacillus sp.]|jgi:phosphoglycolate phosphatase|nr:5-nucleotidase [Massilibacillus sp.]